MFDVFSTLMQSFRCSNYLFAIAELDGALDDRAYIHHCVNPRVRWPHRLSTQEHLHRTEINSR